MILIDIDDEIELMEPIGDAGAIGKHCSVDSVYLGTEEQTESVEEPSGSAASEHLSVVTVYPNIEEETEKIDHEEFITISSSEDDL